MNKKANDGTNFLEKILSKKMERKKTKKKTKKKKKQNSNGIKKRKGTGKKENLFIHSKKGGVKSFIFLR